TRAPEGAVHCSIFGPATAAGASASCATRARPARAGARKRGVRIMAGWSDRFAERSVARADEGRARAGGFERQRVEAGDAEAVVAEVALGDGPHLISRHAAQAFEQALLVAPGQAGR